VSHGYVKTTVKRMNSMPRSYATVFFASYATYSGARGLAKACCEPMLFTDNCPDPEPYDGKENAQGRVMRTPLLAEKMMCVMLSPLVSFLRIPSDMCAAEVWMRGDVPRKYGGVMTKHPLLNGNRYDNILHFLDA